MRAILDRTSLDEYDFAMLGAFGSTTFVQTPKPGAVLSTTLFFGVITRAVDGAAALADAAASSSADMGAAADGTPADAGAAAPAEPEAGNEDDDADDDDLEEDDADADAAPPAAPPADAAAPPDSYDDQWFPLERAAELLSDPDQLRVLQQAVGVFQLAAKVDHTPLSGSDVHWPVVVTPATAAAPAAAAAIAPAVMVPASDDARLPVTVLSGFLGGTPTQKDGSAVRLPLMNACLAVAHAGGGRSSWQDDAADADSEKHGQHARRRDCQRHERAQHRRPAAAGRRHRQTHGRAAGGDVQRLHLLHAARGPARVARAAGPLETVRLRRHRVVRYGSAPQSGEEGGGGAATTYSGSGACRQGRFGAGISAPMPIAETFTFEDARGKRLDEYCRLDTLVTVVDAVGGWAIDGGASVGLADVHSTCASMLVRGWQFNFMNELQSVDTLTARKWQTDASDTRTVVNLLMEQIEFANGAVGGQGRRRAVGQR